MAGDYKGPGHKIVSGETPVVGLRVLTNNLDWGTIVKVADPDGHVTCGWYCEAWHEIQLDTSYKGDPIKGRTIMNCDRLSTRYPVMPR
jgi:hypothetical protein